MGRRRGVPIGLILAVLTDGVEREFRFNPFL